MYIELSGSRYAELQAFVQVNQELNAEKDKESYLFLWDCGRSDKLWDLSWILF